MGTDSLLFNCNFDKNGIFDSLIKRQKLKTTEETMILELLETDIDSVEVGEVTQNIMNLLRNNISAALKILELVGGHDKDFFRE